MAFRYETKYLGFILVAAGVLLFAVTIDSSKIYNFPGDAFGQPLWKGLAFLSGAALFVGLAFLALRPTALVLTPTGVQVNGMRSSKFITWNDIVLATPRGDEVRRTGEAACVSMSREDVEDGDVAEQALLFYEAHPEFRGELGDNRLVCERCVELQARAA